MELLFTKDDFIGRTNPAYHDDEGDSPYRLKIPSLPTEGTLVLSDNPVTEGQSIFINEIQYLKYISSATKGEAHQDSFTYQISDTGSKTYSNIGTITINVSEQSLAPKVSDEYGHLNDTSFTFNQNLFTKEFTDPRGGSPDEVSIVTLPNEGVLEYNNSAVAIGTTFTAFDSQNLVFKISDEYAIHNGVMYRFSKSIDEIITEYKELSLELVANVNGYLTFINPLDLSDIQYVKGVAVELSDLNFKFKVRSNVSELYTDPALFSLIPWENANIKDNFKEIGVDGKNAYELAVDNGFTGSLTEWLSSLEGPQGVPGPKGEDGKDGTSVTIQGSVNDESELPPSGNTVGDGYLLNGYLYVWDGSAWNNVGLIQGPRGKSLEFTWDGTKLGIRVEGGTVYSFSELKGDKGDKGDKGERGLQGVPGPKGSDADVTKTNIESALGHPVVEMDNNLIRVRIPLSQVNLTNTSTDEQVLQAAATWIAQNAPDKKDIETISWEIYQDELVITTTWSDPTIWDDNTTWTE